MLPSRSSIPGLLHPHAKKRKRDIRKGIKQDNQNKSLAKRDRIVERENVVTYNHVFMACLYWGRIGYGRGRLDEPLVSISPIQKSGLLPFCDFRPRGVV